jgi:hypothetical protein
MKTIKLVFIAILLTVSGFAQTSADIGIWGGSSTYWGDIRDVPFMQKFNLNLGAYFRYNFNSRIGLRAQFLTGNFSADGFVEDVEWDFGKMAQDLSLQVEINYLKYILGEKKTPFTPYIMGGIGMMFFPYTFDPARLFLINPYFGGQPLREESVVTPSIPFGFGFKFTIAKRMGIGIEYQLRKIMSDKLDDLDDPLTFNANNTNNGGEETIKYTDIIHNNDWPGYLGVHITYKIYLSRKPCPAYDRKYW